MRRQYFFTGASGADRYGVIASGQLGLILRGGSIGPLIGIGARRCCRYSEGTIGLITIRVLRGNGCIER